MVIAAKRSFDKTIDRVWGLLSLHEPLHGVRGRPRQYVSDILRSSLVLAVAALDALVVDGVSEAVPPLSKKGALGPTVAKWAKDDAAPVLTFFAKADPHRALADMCRDQLAQQTFQRPDAIEGILREVLGAEAPWDRAASVLSSEWEDTFSGDDVKKMLDEYVKRRHRIVHSGDALPGKTSTNPIQVDWVALGVGVIDAVGDALCDVITARF